MVAPQTNSREEVGLKLKQLCGKDVNAYFPELCRLYPEITEIRFLTYRPAPGLTERLNNVLSPEEKALRDTAEQVSETTGIPFWDSLLSISMHRGETPERFVDAALVHNADPGAKTFPLTREQLWSGGIAKLFDQLPRGHGLVVCSRLRVASGDIVQIPMLDFLCPCLPKNAMAIRRMLHCVGLDEGILVESGRSYHFYGVALMSQEEWVTFMAKCLLFSPFTDPRYIAHRLADGECALKVFSSRDGLVPTIVDAFTHDG